MYLLSTKTHCHFVLSFVFYEWLAIVLVVLLLASHLIPDWNSFVQEVFLALNYNLVSGACENDFTTSRDATVVTSRLQPGMEMENRERQQHM
ncbi:hypothetical protein HZ326_12819 [Fusarium oxysporum f. sp. albedinis]|nr:hypothetical protein HZ326_12819 [Fusarium oxysporum f. sp. albedinis]